MNKLGRGLFLLIIVLFIFQARDYSAAIVLLGIWMLHELDYQLTRGGRNEQG